MTKELCSLSVDWNGILSGFPYCATNWSPTKGNSWANQRVSCIPYYDGNQLVANGISGQYTIHLTKNYTSESNRPALDSYPRFIPYKSKACRILVGDAEIYSDSVSVHRIIGPKFTDNPIQYPMITAFFLPINAALPVRMTNMESGPMFVGLYRYDGQIVTNGKPLTDRIWSVRINLIGKEVRKNYTWATLKKNSVYFLIALHKNHTPSNLMNQLLGTPDINKLHSNCTIVYGQNKNKLDQAVKDINEKSLDSLDWEFFFYFIYSGKPQVNRTNDVDHIMPCNILKKMGYNEDDINSMKNFQLLDYGTNRGAKNGKPFLEWIGNEEYVKDKTTYMETHFIPKDESLWDEKHFLEVSKKRGELIAECINKLL